MTEASADQVPLQQMRNSAIWRGFERSPDRWNGELGVPRRARLCEAMGRRLKESAGSDARERGDEAGDCVGRPGRQSAECHRLERDAAGRQTGEPRLDRAVNV
jgi:hypothetical protein